MRSQAGWVVAGLVLLTSCGTPTLELDHSAATGACVDFLAELPSTLNGETRREVRPDNVSAAGYGDPAITVWCDVPVPAEFGIDSACVTANGIDWYAPDEQYLDQDLTVTLTTVYREPAVRVEIPADYRPEGVAAVLAQLAEPVRSHTTSSDVCGSPEIESP